MFLVEIETGREQVYQSVEALAAAIRTGVIGPDSRIFHRASSSWISITLHPEYRKVVAARPEEPLPPLSSTQWTLFGTESQGRDYAETVVEPPAKPPAEPPRPRGLRALFSRRRTAPSPDAAERSSS